MEDFEPTGEYFDIEDWKCERDLPSHGVRITLRFGVGPEARAQAAALLVMRSDTATMSVPEIDLETPGGSARYASVATTMREARDAVASSGFAGGAKFAQFLAAFDELLDARAPFSLVLDDPSGRSFLRYNEDYPDPDITIYKYERTWRQKEELDIEDDEEATALDIESALFSLVDLIEQSNNIVGFTGAGISTGSGIPAFRTTEGNLAAVFSEYDVSVESYSNFLASETARVKYWQLEKHLFDSCSKAAPNPAHRTLMGCIHLAFMDSLKRRVPTSEVLGGWHTEPTNTEKTPKSEPITGNNLAESTNEVENTTAATPNEPPQETPALDTPPTSTTTSAAATVTASTPMAPHCSLCGGPLKPDTISFGQPLDTAVIERAQTALSSADLVIIVGTSLTVAPANKLPEIALDRGIPLVIINKSETPLDKHATLSLQADCTSICASLMENLKWL
ncbi:transcriptional regulator, Sir2 family protein [Pelomyxa schiedti]|nr:transcriptional regulator, Sir2 family protein [Pelomyxa schiedti]